MENLLGALLKKRKEWTLYEDSQLRSYLDDRMSIYQTSSKDIENCLDELNIECERLSLRLETIHSNVSALKFSKSIEERVANVTPLEPANKEPTETVLSEEDASKILTQKIIDEGLKFVSKYFKEVDIVSKDFFAEVDPNYVLDPVYEIKDPYADRPLPEIIGSEAFFNFKMDEKKEFESKEKKVENIIIKIPKIEQQQQFTSLAPETSTSSTLDNFNVKDSTQKVSPASTLKNTIAETLTQKESIPASSQLVNEKNNESKINSNEKIIIKNNLLSEPIEETRPVSDEITFLPKKRVDIIPKIRTQITTKSNITFNDKTLSIPEFCKENLETNTLLLNETAKNTQSTPQNISKPFNTKKTSKGLFSSSSSETEEKEQKKTDLSHNLNKILTKQLKSSPLTQQLPNKTKSEIKNTIITDVSSPSEKQKTIEKNKLFVHKRIKGPDRRAPSNFQQSNFNDTLKTTNKFEKEKSNQLNFSQNSANDFQQTTKVISSINSTITTPSVETVSSPSIISKNTESFKDSVLISSKNNSETKKKIKNSIFDSSTSDENDLFSTRSPILKIVKTPTNPQNLNIPPSTSTKIETEYLFDLNEKSNEPIAPKRKNSKSKLKKSLFDDSDSDF